MTQTGIRTSRSTRTVDKNWNETRFNLTPSGTRLTTIMVVVVVFQSIDQD